MVDSDDSFEWESDAEAEPSSVLALRNMDAAGPSTLVRQDPNGRASGEAPPNSVVEGYVGMGFTREIVLKGIKDIGHSDSNALLELLLTYKTLGDEAVGNCSTSGLIPQSVEDDDDFDFENWDGDDNADGRERNSDGSGHEDFLQEMSEKDKKIKSLVNMGFPEDEANRAITTCGMDAALSVLVDSIYASQAAGNCSYMNLSEYEVTDRGFDSFGGRKKARLMEESKKKMKRYGGGAQGSRPPLHGFHGELMPRPNPMVGFNLPSGRQSGTRSLPKQAVGPPYFYYENMARAPKSVWMEISRSLYDIEPEFVDSKYFCAAVRERGYVHNLPIEKRSPLRPLPPKTIFEAFPHYKKWWPTWDHREQLNCFDTRVASPKQIKQIECTLASSSTPPPITVQKYVMDQCREWNLVWVGKNKVAPLEQDEMEYLHGFPRNHTRGVACRKRYMCLGNSFQVDTVGYHLSVLKDLFPNGINVLSLFTGIGGAEVALHRLGIHMKTVISIEISEDNRRILRGWWDQTQTGTLIEIADVKSLTNDKVASFMRRYGRFDLVIGGLEGEQPALFYHYSRILNAVKSATTRI
ncbi:hypothetical protein QYE76_000669 [Lolium multiflorum]|uniref:SAM-dependent MTase DRM-type domain-containing protein n=1 Tax=Lolium multiflorum TaxID=4521 RepID=A0AAD8RJP3_LOLMU|nr:hypothetical protein QYE76_000669 [Lolium multiflorum]